jgi:quinol monooxygenase YgiN
MAESGAKFGLLATMEAKPGKEDEVEQFLRSAVPLVREEAGTISWYAIRLGNLKFGIFDTFRDEAARQAHVSGKVAQALFAKAPELFSEIPKVEEVDVLAEKLP